MQFKETIKVMFLCETKGGEKVNLRDRPYLEVEVVEVKKQKNKYATRLKDLENMMKIKYFRIFIPDILLELEAECKDKLSKPERKGNWVNGENLDKIKFPCFCSYMVGEVKRLGQINTDFFNGYTRYTLNTIDRQVGNDETTAWGNYESLMQLIVNNKVKILKGKIIIFEEEK